LGENFPVNANLSVILSQFKETKLKFKFKLTKSKKKEKNTDKDFTASFKFNLFRLKLNAFRILEEV